MHSEKLLAQFTRHYEEHKNSVLTYLLYRLNFDRSLGEDLTSEVFLKAFEHFDSFDQARSFKTWIFTIAHNHLINYFTSKKTSYSLDEARYVVGDKAERKQDLFDQRLDLEIMQKLIDRLPNGQRELVAMRYISDLSHKEIAAITGRGEGGIRTALSRAVATLRSMYNEHKTSYL